MPVNGAGQRIREALSEWEGLETAAHRFGGVEFRMGRREIGHVHGDWLVDIPFPTRLRNELVASGLAEPHHIMPETGWVSFYLRQEADVDAAIDLLKRSYDLAARQKGRKNED